MGDTGAAGPEARSAERRRRLAGSLRARLARLSQRHPKLASTLVEPALAIAPRLRHDDVGTNAGALTYSAFLSIPPILLLALSIAGFVMNNPANEKALVDSIVAAVPGLEGAASSTIQRAIDGRVTVGLIAVPGVLWTASGMAARARHALGIVFDTGWSGLMAGRLHALVIALPLGLGLLVLLGIGSLTSVLGSTGSIGVVVEIAIFAALVLTHVLYAILLFRLLTPGQVVPTRDHVPGALLFTVCWFGLQAVGAYYVAAVVARASALYGALGSIFGLIAFLYIASYAFLLSAELSAILRERRERTGE